MVIMTLQPDRMVCLDVERHFKHCFGHFSEIIECAVINLTKWNDFSFDITKQQEQQIFKTFITFTQNSLFLSTQHYLWKRIN